jgi:light-regulated signal transduction histidine kinase (bacteriophytochrome)
MSIGRRIGRLHVGVLLLAIVCGVFAWSADAVVDFLYFHEGPFLDLLIFKVPPHEVHDRSILLFTFIVFGVIVSMMVRRQELISSDLRSNREHLALLNKELQAFNYSISQDLKVPLRHIYGYCEVLSEELSGRISEHELDYLEKVQKAAKQMRHLINNLIDLSKAAIYELQREKMDITILVRQIISDLRSWYPDSRVTYQIDDELQADGDPTLLRIALFSLLSKGFNKNRDNTAAMINIGRRTENGADVFYIHEQDTMTTVQDYAAIRNDPETAIEDGDLENLGLVVAARIIHRHGGRVWTSADGDTGISINFTLTGSDEIISTDAWV